MESMIRHVKSYLNVIKGTMVKRTEKVRNIGMCPCGYKENNVFPPLSEFVPFEYGGTWGSGKDSHAWFRFTVDVPEDMRDDDTLELCVGTEKSGWDADNPQFICYVDGVMRQGLDTNHREVLLGKEKTSYDVYLYAYTGPRFDSAKLMVGIRTIYPEVRKYYYDLLVPKNALECLGTNTVEYMDVLNTLSMSLRKLNMLEPRGEEYLESVREADRYLEEELYGKAKKSDIATICIGHTHIDIAWLWTVVQTREKVQRTFATVIELMKRYPEYKFMSSQAFLYKAVKEEAPELYEEIKKMVKAGRWEVEGAMFVEADCNLSSGESLVRQVLYGKNFFKDEFGVDSKVLWLPDVFGYSAAMPQILKKSGVDWFVTSKISWNDKNTMPYDLFRWTGLDGTSVNTYFLTAQNKGRSDAFEKYTTYVANTDPRMIAGTYNRFQQKELSKESIVTFGFGDGGGGPTAEMLEMARRQENGIPGLPRAEMGFAGDFLGRLGKRAENDPRFPEWRGELYLEFHRGTYTSNARNKKNNRDSEFLMLDAEMLSVAAGLLGNMTFPKEKLHKLWETVLINQFHDIIPGSSIREVYEICDKEYAALRAEAGEIRKRAIDTIVGKIKTDKKYIVFNPHSFVGSGIVKLGDKTVRVDNVPPKGYKAFDLVPGESRVKVSGNVLENDHYICTFDENMEISSLYDKDNGREVIKAGERGNQLRIYEDYPDQYDAWEIQDFANYKYYSLKEYESAEVVSDGARTGMRIVRRHGASLLEQTVWLEDAGRRIDFETHLDWHSKHRILRAAFPVDINTDKASFEVQFGTIERPTHKNTSWDRMKFETCGQKFADVSEGCYGVSLLNNCKYGHDIHGDLMQLTLLKCPTYPNEVADEGEHFFTYSILPHAGTLKDSDTVREAYALGYPMYAVPTPGTSVSGVSASDMSASGSSVPGVSVSSLQKSSEATLPEEWSLVSTDKKELVIETVKEAEKSEDIIIRMYESKNFRGRAKITLGVDVSELWLSDLSENKLEKLPLDGRTAEIDYRPFEIITLCAVRK